MIYEYECPKCGLIFEEVRSYEERNNVFHCEVRAVKLISTSINTEKDLAYNFVSNSFGKPVHIRSKAHYNSLLKQNNMVSLTKEEIRTIKKPDNSYKKKQFVKRVSNKLQDAGLAKHVPNMMKDCFIKK